MDFTFRESDFKEIVVLIIWNNGDNYRQFFCSNINKMMYFPSKLSPHTFERKSNIIWIKKIVFSVYVFWRFQHVIMFFLMNYFLLELWLTQVVLIFIISPKKHIKLIKLDIYDWLKVYPKRRNFCEKIKIKSDVRASVNL